MVEVITCMQSISSKYFNAYTLYFSNLTYIIHIQINRTSDFPYHLTSEFNYVEQCILC